MKKIELFVCEICGTQYSSKLACESCEKSHKIPVKIVRQRYVDPKNHGGYPVSVTIEFNNGEQLVYKR